MIKFREVLLLLILLFTNNSFACKQAALNENFPIDDFSVYDTIVIATIDSVSYQEEKGRRFSKPLESFEATVVETLKGDLKPNDRIKGKAKKEQALAVCSVFLTKYSIQLLLLNKDGQEYNISRFSFPTPSHHVYFSRYVKEIKEALAR
ncbi:hypothetical protein [Aliikangiella sp. IMCC44359]|uniref:hypothetical protein n=1 Tax=Aliikangiella sp. IMCC44359 TaxID=3459125 RepID=UPI00403AC21F